MKDVWSKGGKHPGILNLDTSHEWSSPRSDCSISRVRALGTYWVRDWSCLKKRVWTS